VATVLAREAPSAEPEPSLARDALMVLPPGDWKTEGSWAGPESQTKKMEELRPVANKLV
jgi:hypothetical protein